MSDRLKPTCEKYILQSRQGQSLEDQDLVEPLVNDPQCFIRSGIRFPILGAEYLVD